MCSFILCRVVDILNIKTPSMGYRRTHYFGQTKNWNAELKKVSVKKNTREIIHQFDELTAQYVMFNCLYKITYSWCVVNPEYQTQVQNKMQSPADYPCCLDAPIA